MSALLEDRAIGNLYVSHFYEKSSCCTYLYYFSGAMVGGANQLMTGNVGGALQLWSVDHTHSPPSVSMTKTMEVDGGIFSAAFDSKMELVNHIKFCQIL